MSAVWIHPDGALPKGEWVGGLVKKFVPWTPPHMPAHTLGHTCDCGCLLLNADEFCPSCATLQADRTVAA